VERSGIKSRIENYAHVEKRLQRCWLALPPKEETSDNREEHQRAQS
jgi:hypothetical protein